MKCPVCNGSGITRVTHLRVVYTLGVPCGGCGGTGVVDDTPDNRPLLDRMLSKHNDLLEAISDITDLPVDLKRQWHDRLERISVTQPGAESALSDLQREVDEAENDFPLCELALIYCDLGELSRMCAEYHVRTSH
jgi:hypothetical protein